VRSGLLLFAKLINTHFDFLLSFMTGSELRATSIQDDGSGPSGSARKLSLNNFLLSFLFEWLFMAGSDYRVTSLHNW
jgi:hypothetical protein